MPLAVVQGAELKCDKCPATSRLIVTTESSTQIEGKPPATVQDHLPFINVPPFPGKCAILGIDCIPLTFLPWGTSFTNILLSLLSAEIVGADAKLKCLVGGTISITDPNQSTMPVGLAEAREELADALVELYKAEGPSDAQIRQAEKALRELEAQFKRTGKDTEAAAAVAATKGGVPIGALAAALAGLSAYTGSQMGRLAAAYEDAGEDAEDAEEGAEEAADRVRKMTQGRDGSPTANDLISGSGKDAPSYHKELGHKTYKELEDIKGNKGESSDRRRRAGQMIKLIDRGKQNRAKAKGGDKGRGKGKGKGR